MDTIDLPLIAESGTPKAALRAMREAKRSGIVVVGAHGSSWIALGGPVAQAWKKGVATMREVTGLQSAVILARTPNSHPRLSVDTPRITADAYRELFKEIVPNHAVFFGTGVPEDPANPRVTVVTASEALMPALQMLGAYICDGPSRHTYPSPDMSSRDPCPLCPPSIGATVSLIVV
jgi:hypothetical protein